MDGELFDYLDSLWFLSCVLKPSSQLLPQNAQISRTIHECTNAEKQEKAVEEQKIENEPSQVNPKVKESPNCKNIVVLEKHRVKRKGKRSKNRVQKWVQQSSDAMQLENRTPFSVLYDGQMRNSASDERDGIDSHFRNLTMPRVRDDLEMKAQLRSWAHAVACSVK